MFSYDDCLMCGENPCTCAADTARIMGQVVQLEEHRMTRDLLTNHPRDLWPGQQSAPSTSGRGSNPVVMGTVVNHPTRTNHPTTPVVAPSTDVAPVITKPSLLPTVITPGSGGSVVEFLRSDATAAKTARAALTHSYCVAAGTGVIARAGWDWLTFGHYTKAANVAQQLGDYQSAAKIAFMKDRAIEQRFRRLRDSPKVATATVATCAFITAVLFVMLVFFAAAAHLSGHGDFISIVGGTFALIGAIAGLVIKLTPWVLLLAPFLGLGYVWYLGKTRTDAPTWVRTSGDAEVCTAIDERALVNALAALRITGITQYLKTGQPLQFITPARRDGRGTHAVIRLPIGVSAETVVKRRQDLATGVYRSVKEVWPSVGAEAGVLDVWIADKGALKGGAGPWPVMNDGPTTVDAYKGIPFGRTLRGDEVKVPVVARNTIIGGMPGQGKSSGARVIMAGLALDPTVELRIYVPDTNFDFESFKPRCSKYVMGADDDALATIAADFAALEAEVQHRGDLLVQFQAQEVSPKLARAGVGLHLMVVLLEEAHVMIQDRTHGGSFADSLESIVKFGRKRNIHIIVSTQAPTADSMPRGVTRNCATGVAYAVGDHTANDGLLGQGSYKAGHRATELIPGTDAGTCVIKGASGEARSEMVQTYRLRADDIPSIIDAAMSNIHKTGNGVPGTGANAYTPAVVEERDLLADVFEALNGRTVRTADVPALLVALAPGWKPYTTLTGKALREQLKAVGVTVPSTGNTWPIRPELINDALHHRAARNIECDTRYDVTDRAGHDTSGRAGKAAEAS